MKKLIRTSTVALSLDVLLKGQLRFLNDSFHVIGVSGEDKHLKNVRNREGVETIAVAMQREISPLKDLVSLVKLYQLFKKEKPFIVHSITPKAGLLSMTAAYFAGVPVRIHTFTGLIFPTKTGFLQKILITMDKLLCRCATHIYPEGNGVKNDLLAYKITNKPLKVIANGNVNGIDTTFYSPALFTENDTNTLKNELQIEPNDFVFIFVGRLVKDKGINELVHAFSNFQKTNSNSKLLLVGPFETDLDPLQADTLALIKSNHNIIATGYKNDVRPYFAIADALVFPSYREGFPNVVLQAGAMGLPAIVTDINGCNEIIKNNTNGFIIPSKNQEALEIAIKELIENKVVFQQMKLNSRLLIQSQYEQSVVWNAILEEYRKFDQN